MTESESISALVTALPEKYQPIFGHPELSEGSSRGCEDRLTLIAQCAKLMQDALGRPLRVLDLGCAQGFFSLSLAADGHRVHGVDFLDRNIALCQALARDNSALEATFEHATVEEVIERLEDRAYDLVLGLSVFHHLVHAQGIARVNGLCQKLADSTEAGIFEMALREEPLYWAGSLPSEPAELLAGYAFTRLLSRQTTHLSAIARPLYFASSRFWYVDEVVGKFDSWSSESHAHGMGTHQYSRRYYFGGGVFVKKMTLGMGDRAQINFKEFRNEVDFLRNPPDGYGAPRLIAALDDRFDLFLAREMMKGRLLSELIDDETLYDADRVVSELLDQLVALERARLYHNDVRCWNVLMTQDGHAVLIDYGAISPEATDSSWLDDPLLAFLITVKEILERRIVPTSPSREPALDLMSLPFRYRNAFVRLFGRARARWTFQELQDNLASPEPVSDEVPEWMSIYQYLQQSLRTYSGHVRALYMQSEHEHAALMASESSLARVRDDAQQGQEKFVALQLELEMAANRYHDLEENSRRMAEWSKELEEHAKDLEQSARQLSEQAATLEARAVEAEASRNGFREQAAELQARAAKFEANNLQLSGRIAELEIELEERQRACELAELLAANVGRLTAERDQLQEEIAQKQLSNGRLEADIAELQSTVASLLQRIERFETSGEHDRRRLKELQANLSQRNQDVETARARVRELEYSVSALEGLIAEFYTSRSWRVTAPLRWVTTKVLRRDNPSAQIVPRKTEPANAIVYGGDLPSPAEAALEKRLAALDQIGRRVRKPEQ
ncbi:methyltransferase domain-containing protein [Xanthomonas fragariae]|uniref:methyltransferase domain-containing protein n=1 Tax=Xanthomonas fragariae TaxID=48664 RepID=UPI000A35D067|nr:methyltransferase domain-containing protein [Xanthomonas fragariae]SMQ94169.1 protein kinase [Xanthomonas fragariae]